MTIVIFQVSWGFKKSICYICDNYDDELNNLSVVNVFYFLYYLVYLVNNIAGFYEEVSVTCVFILIQQFS